MDATLKAIVFLVAAACFAVEAVRTRSLVAAGLAVFTIPFLWDAFEAA